MTQYIVKEDLVLSISIAALRQIAKPILKTVLKNKLVKEFGEDFVSKLLKQFDDVTDLGKYIKQLKKAGISKDLMEQFADKYGKEGLDWLLRKKHLGLTDGVIRKQLKAEDLSKFTEDVLRAIKNLDEYADDIIRCITKYGDDITEAVIKYGDDAVEVLKKGKTLEEIIKINLINEISDIRSKLPTLL